MKKRLTILLACCAAGWNVCAAEESLAGRLTLKTPGNDAVTYELHTSGGEFWKQTGSCR